MVHTAHMLWQDLGAHVWLEWIDSKSNPADGLSRLGLSDPWTRQQPWRLEESPVPPWRLERGRPDVLYHELRDIGVRSMRWVHWG